MPERNRSMKPGSRRWRQAANEGGQRGIRTFFSAQKPKPPSNRAPSQISQATTPPSQAKTRLELPTSASERSSAEEKIKAASRGQEQIPERVSRAKTLRSRGLGGRSLILIWLLDGTLIWSPEYWEKKNTDWHD